MFKKTLPLVMMALMILMVLPNNGISQEIKSVDFSCNMIDPVDDLTTLDEDPDTGLMVTRFIEGSVTMSPQNFASRKGSPARAGEAFARLHRSGAEFPFRFELFRYGSEASDVREQDGHVPSFSAELELLRIAGYFFHYRGRYVLREGFLEPFLLSSLGEVVNNSDRRERE